MLTSATILGSARLETDARIPALLGRERWYSREARSERAGLPPISRVPRLLQASMVQAARSTFARLQHIPEEEWFAIFDRAADLLLDPAWSMHAGTGNRQECARLAAAFTGLPPHRLIQGWEVVAHDMRKLRDILLPQAPGGALTAYRSSHVPSGKYRWVPAGKFVAVRVPGNYPTINVMWLQALAMRRPVILCTSDLDPMTPLRIALALYAAGLPEDAISICHGSAQGVFDSADQVIWPGRPTAGEVPSTTPLLNYHFGRSKVVLPHGAEALHDSDWGRLAGLAAHGCGRLCTNMSGLVVVGRDAESAARRLARSFSGLPVVPPLDPTAILPWCSDPAAHAALLSELEAELSAGAVDVSALETGLPLELEVAGLKLFRPTVLLVSPSSKVFGRELPFPFVTVTPAIREDVPSLCRGSLAVYVAGNDAELAEELLHEPSIDKVFWGETYDHQYDPTEPHQGYLADFLFSKKASSRQPSLGVIS